MVLLQILLVDIKKPSNTVHVSFETTVNGHPRFHGWQPLSSLKFFSEHGFVFHNIFSFYFQAFKEGLCYHLDKFKYSNATTGRCNLKNALIYNPQLSTCKFFSLTSISAYNYLCYFIAFQMICGTVCLMPVPSQWLLSWKHGQNKWGFLCYLSRQNRYGQYIAID